MQIKYSDRINVLPPYLFVEIDRLKREAAAKGTEILNFGIGDPDMGTPEFIVDALYEAAKDSDNHHYALDAGMPVFKQSLNKWMAKRFSVILEEKSEILPVIGSKEAIGHIPMAFVNPGDVVLYPDPGYPVYRSSTLLCGGEPISMPLLEENDFFPDFSKISEETFRKTKLMFLNYPNNPTAACATEEFFKQVIEIAKKYNIIICHDAAYTEVAFDGYKPISFLSVPGAKEVGIEFHSMSKTFNMTGWRVGFAAGNKEVLSGLAKIKANLDSGIFQAIQLAAKKAVDEEIENDVTSGLVDVYKKRRDALVSGLASIGWEVKAPKATFYIWTKLPKGFTSSTDFVKKLITEAGIITTPGVGFGPSGEGYVRFALTVGEDKIAKAVNKLKKIIS